MRPVHISRTMLLLASLWMLVQTSAACGARTNYRTLPVREYRDKMMAGWVGQMVGVAWGAPTEFGYSDKVMPESSMPQWKPSMVNDSFTQDDLYVEMTFLRSLEAYGLDVPIRQAGIDFANTKFALYCANDAGRRNLRRGIAPPDSGHPKFTRCPDDIDYQIEADYSGLIAPGMPNVPIALGRKFGRLMNYGDGVYAGQFVGGMYAEAFFEKDIRKVVEAGLTCIPSECQYAEMVRDMLKWSREIPDWQKTWQLCEEKYRKNPEYQKASNGGIDCKINGAYVLMGLLYGGGDPDKTITIACRCGQDSDCNPSSAAGVLFTTIGFSKLPDRFTKELRQDTAFVYTPYRFPALIDVCEKLAKKELVRQGGKTVKDAKGEEVMRIPLKQPIPSPLELSWAPGPITGSIFTEDEMSRIAISDKLKKAVQQVAPGWTLSDCGSELDPGLREVERGRRNVLVTHPLDPNTPCVLKRTVDIPAGKKTTLKLTVANHPSGDWDLIVKADGKELVRKTISNGTTKNGWLDFSVDLSEYAGKRVKLELLNQPTGWFFEAGYWAEISLASE